MSDSFLELRNLTKRFGDHLAVTDLCVTVPQGGVLALLGPSGSGKTTTLRLLAGFERPDMGEIIVDGRDVTGLSPAQRRFGMVFQHYALFPHLTVGENVAFGLARRDSRERRTARVDEMLALVDLTGFAHRKVTELSGGQQQRVAVARALAPEPRVLLLDEPLSNLDPGLRERTRVELRAALAKIGVTTVLVTHEQEEAFALGDRVAVLRGGRLEQVGPAHELYERPQTLFVATFVGRASEVPAMLHAPGQAQLAIGGEWAVETPHPVPVGSPVRVVVRPEALRFAEQGVRGTVVGRRYTGARAYFRVRVGEGITLEVEAPVHAAQIGQTVGVVAVRAHAFPEKA